MQIEWTEYRDTPDSTEERAGLLAGHVVATIQRTRSKALQDALVYPVWCGKEYLGTFDDEAMAMQAVVVRLSQGNGQGGFDSG